MKPRRRFLTVHALWRVIAYVLLTALFYYALRHAPLANVWSVLRQLQWWQMLSLLAIELTIYGLITARWWLVIRAEKQSIGFAPLIAVRIAVFAISYFTFGPQIGGEPLQILYLQRLHALTYTRATASVVMDKLLEFVANFVLLGFGSIALFQTDLILTHRHVGGVGLIAVLLILALPTLYLFLLYWNIHPFSRIAVASPFHKAGRFVAATEQLAGRFCRRHPRQLLAAIAVSLTAAVAMVSEYFLMTSFLGIHLTFWQTSAAWTSGWLSFLAPVPGGLGALEASQVFVLNLMNVSAAAAVSVALLIRGRDLLIGGLGLILAGRYLQGNDT